MDTVLRLYGVVRPGDRVPDGVRALEDAALTALVEDVPAADWSAAALPARLEDLGWLEMQARRHDSVLRACLPRPVVPFPLTTVFSDDGHVRAMLRDRRGDLTAELDRVDGRAELGVVVHVDRGAAAPTGTEPGAAAPTSGAAYIADRLAQRRQADTARTEATAVAERVHTRLSGRAVAAVRGKPRPEALDDEPGWNVLNASYLVPLDQLEEFDREVRAVADELRATGARVRRTGPWAPFHFVGEPAR